MRQDFTLIGGAAAVDLTSRYCIDMRFGSEVQACELVDASGIFGIEIDFTCQGTRVSQLDILNLCFG